MGVIAWLIDVEMFIVEIAIIICDLIGVGIRLVTVIRSAINYFRHSIRVRLMLAQGISLALGFKLGGEVLRTITVRDWNEFAILGAIIVLRAAITLLIHWEIKTEISEEKHFQAERKLNSIRYSVSRRAKNRRDEETVLK
jgi:uncharacterized membrane protein